MAGLVPAIHVSVAAKKNKTWMPGIKPGMTSDLSIERRVTNEV
jgi:hypothetical protein